MGDQFLFSAFRLDEPMSQCTQYFKVWAYSPSTLSESIIPLVGTHQLWVCFGNLISKAIMCVCLVCMYVWMFLLPDWRQVWGAALVVISWAEQDRQFTVFSHSLLEHSNREINILVNQLNGDGQRCGLSMWDYSVLVSEHQAHWNQTSSKENGEGIFHQHTMTRASKRYLIAPLRVYYPL